MSYAQLLKYLPSYFIGNGDRYNRESGTTVKDPVIIPPNGSVENVGIAAEPSSAKPKDIPYDPPYSNGIPVGKLSTRQLYKSMADYEGQTRMFLHTSLGSGLMIYSDKVDTRFLEPTTKKLVKGVYDSRGKVTLESVLRYKRLIEGREDDKITWPEEYPIASSVVRFHTISELGFRCKMEDTGYYAAFPHLIKLITEHDVTRLSGLEMKVVASKGCAVQVEIRDLGLVRLIEQGNEIKVDNRHRMTVSKTYSRLGALKDISASGQKEFTVNQGEEHLVVVPSQQNRLLNHHMNEHENNVTESNTQPDYVTKRNSLEFYSRLLLYPYPLAASA